MPKLSIITVNFNNKDGLIDTAKSVVAQTWTDYEWIIIDGGSTDGSVEVIKEYAEKTDKLVYWCSELDGGIYQGMNKGIEKANGEYCWFLNSGDYAYKDTILEEIFGHEFDEDIVYGDVEIKNKTKETYIKSQKAYNVKSPVFWVIQTINHQSSFMKRILFENIGNYQYNKYKICADAIFYMTAIFKYNASVKYIPVIFLVYMQDGMSSNPQNAPIIFKERTTYFKDLFSCSSFSHFIFRILSSFKYGRMHAFFFAAKNKMLRK